MPSDLVTWKRSGPVAEIVLNDPARRNALGLAMFDALETSIASVRDDPALRIVLLRGEGAAFCAGFDLAAAVEDPALMGQFIRRLSRAVRDIRRLPQVVVIAVQGAAIAGGCALLGAGDFVVMAADARAGYPVHRLGVSPAVTIPALAAAIGSGPARVLLLSGRLIDGAEAHRIGLATDLSESGEVVLDDARRLCDLLASKPSAAQRITKSWLNELDGSVDDARFDSAAEGSIELAAGDEARRLLREFWQAR
jgi:enoyl-CoA hydratase/carnithine racemase